MLQSLNVTWVPVAFATAVTCLLAMAGPAQAQSKDQPVGVVSHVLVLSDKSEDVSSPEAWKRTYIKDGMSDQEKALAIWRTVVRYRHQTNPSCEFLSPEANVHDPLKTIHVYGYGMCCCASSNVCGLARYLGMNARGRGISAHMISEVFYDNAWHMLDGSLMNYFLKPDGRIASADEINLAVTEWLTKNPTLRGNNAKLVEFAAKGNWKKNGPALLATCTTFDDNGFNAARMHGWHATMQEYDFKTAGPYEYWPAMGYQLNVQLREGEKLTRNWGNKGQVIDWTDADIMTGGQSILGQQRKLGDKAPGRIGNGVLTYEVPLASGAFRGGALVADNVACTAEDKVGPALHVKNADTGGVLVLRMPSSYVYLTGLVDLKAVVGERGAVVVSYSANQGLDWREVANLTASGDQKINLAKLDASVGVYRKYDYRLKFELKGKGTGLDALKITHDVQHSQAPLPTLTEGPNTITFSAGPAEGTITYEFNPDPDNTRGKQLSIKDFHPTLHNMNLKWLRPQGKGDATFTIPAPGEITRVRMSLSYRLRDANDSFTALASFDDGKTFKEVGKLTGPTAGNARYLTLTDVPPGAKTAVVKIEGKEVNTACIFGLRIDVDYKEPAGGFRPVKISYVWDEGGQEKSDVHVAKRPQESYTITCGPKTTVKSFAVELDR